MSIYQGVYSYNKLYCYKNFPVAQIGGPGEHNVHVDFTSGFHLECPFE